jgi:hypothetical protein
MRPTYCNKIYSVAMRVVAIDKFLSSALESNDQLQDPMTFNRDCWPTRHRYSHPAAWPHKLATIPVVREMEGKGQATF